jgi:DNA-binding NarL/FixJ family response regulator
VTRVFVAARQPSVAEALAIALARESGITVLGFAVSIDATAKALAEHPVDVLLVGGSLFAEMKAADSIRRAAGPAGVRIVILAMDAASPRWMRAPGVAETVLAVDTELAALIEALKGVHPARQAASEGQNLAEALDQLRGQVRAQRTMIRSARARLDAQKEEPRAELLKASLTKRERDVVLLLQMGHDVSAISRRLGLSMNTVRGHVKQILWKTGAHSQLEAVAICVKAGVLRGEKGDV